MSEMQQAIASLNALCLRLEQMLAALAIEQAAVRAVKPVTVSTVAAPKRITTAQACAQLQCSRTALEVYASRGLLTQLRPKGAGRGKPVYYLPEEIAALSVSELEAAQAVQRRQRRRWR